MIGQKSIPRVVTLHLIALLFVIFNVSNIKVAGLSNVIPLFDLMMIFYFAVFRNEFAMWFIFLMGIWSDALMGTQFGITSLCYIVSIRLFLALNDKLNIKETFEHIWKQFIAFSGFFLVMKWAIMSIFGGVFYAVNVIVVQFVLSSFLYVVMHKFFDYLSVKLLDDSL